MLKRESESSPLFTFDYTISSCSPLCFVEMELAQFESLLHLADELAQGVEIKDRKSFNRSYPPCFLGNEAVDYISKSLKIGRAGSLHIPPRLIHRVLTCLTQRRLPRPSS